MTYCEFAADPTVSGAEYHKKYHDNYYGFPIEDDNELFGRFILEINQAGLNWLTILKKEDAFRRAYHNFNIKEIAGYDEHEEKRLLADASIIRNKLKVKAAIHNAQVVLRLQSEYGSFKKWLDHHDHKIKTKANTIDFNPRLEWTKLFKKTFKFTGGEIVNEFLMSTGYLEGAHTKECPIYQKILHANPAWRKYKE